MPDLREMSALQRGQERRPKGEMMEVMTSSDSSTAFILLGGFFFISLDLVARSTTEIILSTGLLENSMTTDPEKLGLLANQ